MNNCFILATLGHTAAGKTTLSKFLVNSFQIQGEIIEYIEEGRIKRELVCDYSTNDSLNEELRDMAYRKAIDIAIGKVCSNNVLLDASFHKLARRQMLYDAIINNRHTKNLIWLYCYCPNINKVEKRIEKRKIMKKEAHNQADSMDIYYHIINTFDLPCIEELPSSITGTIIYFDTDNNIIENVIKCNKNPEMDTYVEKISNYINIQYKKWRDCEC